MDTIIVSIFLAYVKEKAKSFCPQDKKRGIRHWRMPEKEGNYFELKTVTTLCSSLFFASTSESQIEEKALVLLVSAFSMIS